MEFIFSLAHYCEVHGPTSVICTQALPEPCSSCDPHSEPLPPLDHDGRFDDSPTSFYRPSRRPSYPNHTPSFGLGDVREEDRWRRFTGAAEAEDDACPSCSFGIPNDVTRRLPDGAPGSPSSGSGTRRGSPVLRTKASILAECEHALDEDDYSDAPDDGSRFADDPLALAAAAALAATLGPSNASPDSLGSSYPKSSALPIPRSARSARRASTSSPPASPPKPHQHQLTYLTTRHPAQPTLYTALRHSCIRTLSLENLPRGTPSGPLLFGDAHSGHTIAFIFRLPDPCARGRRRTYALLALHPGHDAARVGRAMARVVAVFRQIASWIVGLAERAGERGGPAGSGSGPDGRPLDDDDAAAADPSPPAPHAAPPPVSSFFSAKRPDGGLGPPRRRLYGSNTDPLDAPGSKAFAPPGRADAAGAKGLAELVGREGLFVELHVAFVRALVMLTREFGAA